MEAAGGRGGGVQGRGWRARETERGRKGEGGNRGWTPAGQATSNLFLSLCLCQGLSLSAGPGGFFLLISASFQISLCDLHTNT